MPLSENEVKQIEDLIDSVEVNKGNLEYIAQRGKVNGSLRAELRRILTAQAEKYQNEVEQLKLEIKILRRESRDVDIDYNLHEGKGENNELL